MDACALGEIAHRGPLARRTKPPKIAVITTAATERMSIFFHLDLEPPSAPITSPGAGVVVGALAFDLDGRRDMIGSVGIFREERLKEPISPQHSFRRTLDVRTATRLGLDAGLAR